MMANGDIKNAIKSNCGKPQYALPFGDGRRARVLRTRARRRASGNCRLGGFTFGMLGISGACLANRTRCRMPFDLNLGFFKIALALFPGSAVNTSAVHAAPNLREQP